MFQYLIILEYYEHSELGSQSMLMSEIRIKISGFSMKL